MQNQSIGDYPFYSFDNSYYFITDDSRSYVVEFVEQPFFAEDEYAYAQSTYEVFLRLEKARHRLTLPILKLAQL